MIERFDTHLFLSISFSVSVKYLRSDELAFASESTRYTREGIPLQKNIACRSLPLKMIT
jgi:hypothetical protein